jgi:hypothetical protein
MPASDAAGSHATPPDRAPTRPGAAGATGCLSSGTGPALVVPSPGGAVDGAWVPGCLAARSRHDRAPAPEGAHPRAHGEDRGERQRRPAPRPEGDPVGGVPAAGRRPPRDRDHRARLTVPLDTLAAASAKIPPTGTGCWVLDAPGAELDLETLRSAARDGLADQVEQLTAVGLVLAARLPQVGAAAHRPAQRQGVAAGLRRCSATATCGGRRPPTATWPPAGTGWPRRRCPPTASRSPRSGAAPTSTARPAHPAEQGRSGGGEAGRATLARVAGPSGPGDRPGRGTLRRAARPGPRAASAS